MRTVFNQADRLELSRRLDALAPGAAARWGRMDCPQMLAHLSESVRMAACLGLASTAKTFAPDTRNRAT